MGNTEQQPFSVFGIALKRLREKHSKSHAEVSGAVEIDEKKLQDYEQGKVRPPEDVLSLIIQHFNLKDEEAKEIWRLAGYTESFDEAQYFMNDDTLDPKQTRTVVVTPQDARIVYTDMVQVMVNNYGVIVNFMQGAGINNQPLAVSRVGMSREHAKSIVDVLTKTLEQSEDVRKPQQVKQLPPSTQQQQE